LTYLPKKPNYNNFKRKLKIQTCGLILKMLNA